MCPLMCGRSGAAVWAGEYPHLHCYSTQEEDRGLCLVSRFPSQDMQVSPLYSVSLNLSHSLVSCSVVYRTIPLFVWHRQNWNVVYPQLSLEHKGEMEHLAKHSTYVAGFLDPSVQGRTDLYDLLVNGEPAIHPYTSAFFWRIQLFSSSGSIFDSGSSCKRYNYSRGNPSPTVMYICVLCSGIMMCISTDSFMMTKLHKDIAMHMMQCAQSEEHSDNSTIKVTPQTIPSTLHLSLTQWKIFGWLACTSFRVIDLLHNFQNKGEKTFIHLVKLTSDHIHRSIQ